MVRVMMKHKPPESDMGRFGGGWQWKVGFQASAGFKTIIINLLVFSVQIDRGLTGNERRAS